MNTRWRKVAGDLRQHRRQVALIAVVLTLGTACVVAALDTCVILKREIGRSYARSNSPDVLLSFDRVPDGLLEALRARPGVADADARRVISTKVASRTVGEWLPMRVIVVPDLTAQRVGVVHRHGDDWPDAAKGLLIEQSSLPLLPEGVGGALRFRQPGGNEATLTIAGSVHDTAVAPGVMERLVYAYAGAALLPQLGLPADFDQVGIILEDRHAGALRQVEELNAWLNANGTPSLRTELLPNIHPHAGLMTALLQVLQGLAGLGFVCSVAVAALVISLWMKRETRQVGIMKTIGARSHQLAAQYFALVAPVVILTTGLGFAVGAVAGRALITYSAHEQNIDVTRWDVPASLKLMELLATAGIPLLAMAVPIVRAARTSVRAAFQDCGITAPPAGPWATKWIRTRDRRWTFALRNSFRRKGRLALILISLGVGGAVMLTANNLYSSLMGVIDAGLRERGHDLQVQFTRPISLGEITALAASVPGVAVAEPWQRATVELDLAGSSPATGSTAPAGSGPRALLNAYPVESRLGKLTPVAGRWPERGESGAVVVTLPLQARIPALRLGAEFAVKYRERTTKLRVVGLVAEIATPVIYGDGAVFGAVTGVTDRATELRVKAGSEREIPAVVAALEQAILTARLPAGPILTRAQVRESYDEHFANFVVVCNVVALAAAAIGAIGLIAFASLNVIERSREIGVIRAIGAPPRSVQGMFLAESASVVALSAALAVALAWPASRLINHAIAVNALQVPIPLVISKPALVVVAAAVPVVMVGVWLALRRVLRLSVREVLAYE